MPAQLNESNHQITSQWGWGGKSPLNGTRLGRQPPGVYGLDRLDADDLSEGLRVWDAARGVQDLGERQLRRIDLLPTARLADAPARLQGTLRTRQGDFSGFVHCLDAKTGRLHWVHDLLAQTWGSPLIVDGKVYIGDEDGTVTVFQHSREKKILSTINMENAVYSAPIVANNVLYIANRTTLFAIAPKE